MLKYLFTSVGYRTRRFSSKMDSFQDLHPYGNKICFLENAITSADPFKEFHNWFQFAQNNCKLGFEEINAMALSTATKDGKPSCRMVLMKGYGNDGFRFFTNYNSRKGQQLSDNPWACLMFYWPSINRSVRIEGCVSKLPIVAAEEYWNKRPPASQASAFISEQSRPVASREVLEERIQVIKTTFIDESKPIPRPEAWGGYILAPDLFEFWHGSEDRLHDRITFRKLMPNEDFDDKLLHKGEGDWYYERLQP